MKRHLTSSLLGGAYAVLGATTATAQQTPSPPAVAAVVPDQSEPAASQEIVVTARKRAESIMNVPVVATSVGQETLTRLGTNDIKALATLVPGLSLGTSVLSVGTLVSLRGVGTSALDPGVDTSVSLNIDGLPLSQGLAYASGMFDVGDVTVLKGPQSLFYGKSAPGGVISLRTADPNDHFEFIARGGYEFEARERRGEAIISGPMTDTLRVRLAGAYGQQDGFFKNPAIAIPNTGAAGPSSRRLGPSRDYKLRTTILFKPSSSFDARIKLNRAYDFTNYSGTIQNVLCPDGTGPVGRQYISPADTCRLDRYVPQVDMDPNAFPGIPNSGVPYNKTVQTFGSAELNFHLQPTLTLTSQTGYYLANSNSLLNGTGSAAAMGLFDAVNVYQRRQFTQEVRLVSDYSGPLNFTVGGYFERGRFFDDVTIQRNAIGFPVAGVPAGTPIFVQRGKKTVHIRTESVFGQLLYKITPKLELAGGLRWTSERRNENGTFLSAGAGQPAITPATAITNNAIFAVPRISAKNFAPEISLTYRVTPDLTIFGDVKQGYKSGSFNVSTPPFNGEDNSFGDERVRGGEVGIKARTPDRRLSFNAAAFYYKYRGLQVGANVQATAGVTVTRTVNAGQARSYGVEADITYRPEMIDGLSLRAGGLYNNTRYTSLINVPCYGGQRVVDGCNLLVNSAGLFTAQDRSGLPLIRAPKFSATFGFDYEMPMANGMKLIVSDNNQYQTRQLVNLGYVYFQRAFIKADASLTLQGIRDRWELALIGKNLNNRITTGNCSNGNRAAGNAGGQITGGTTRGVAGVDEVGCWADRGRELWVRATFKY